MSPAEQVYDEHGIGGMSPLVDRRAFSRSPVCEHNLPAGRPSLQVSRAGEPLSIDALISMLVMEPDMRARAGIAAALRLRVKS